EGENAVVFEEPHAWTAAASASRLRPARARKAQRTMRTAMETIVPAAPGIRGACDLGATPAATRAATSTPASPSPATEPEAARIPASPPAAAAPARRLSTQPRTRPPTQIGDIEASGR